MDVADREPGRVGLVDECFELFGLQREVGVHAAVGAAKGHVLFEDRGTEGDGSNAYADALSVVGKPADHVPGVAQYLDRTEVRGICRGRVGGRASKDGDLVVSFCADCFHGKIDVGRIGGAGGKNDGLAGPCNGTEQRNVTDLERCDLVQFNIQIFEQVNGCGVEGA